MSRRLKRAAREPIGRVWEVAGICVLLVVLVFVVFGQTLRFGFVNYDDDANVYGTPEVVAGLSPRGIEWAFTHTQVGRWAPVATISRMADCQFFGLWAGGHHLTNVLLHALAAVALFFALRELTGSTRRSGFVAALFAVHPLHVESVAWVSARGEMLCGLFFVLAVWSYAIYARDPKRRLHYALSLLWFLLGFLSKPMIVSLPLVLLLLDYWPLGRFEKVPVSSLLLEKIPFLLLAAVFCIVTFFVTPPAPAAGQPPLWLRIENALVSYCVYLRQTVWPADLAGYYPNPTHAFPWWVAAGSLALLASISAAAFRFRKSHPQLLVGWLWYAAMLIPVAGIVQISNYAHADRYTYLPQIGLCIGATWAVADWARGWRHGRAALGAMAVAVPCVLLAAAWRQTGYWRDSETLWRHTLACTQENYVAHNDLGNVLAQQQGQAQAATAEYSEAVRINPDYADARNNLAHMLFLQGRAGDALDQYREALRLDPGSAQIHNTFGMDLYQMGRVDDAAAEFREALQINPDYADAHTCLGNVMLAQGRAEDAIDQYREVLRINPADALAAGNLCNVLMFLFQHGRAEEAMSDARQCLETQPANASIQRALAWMLAASQPRRELGNQGPL